MRLEIALVNEGTCPAEDIAIFINYPDGFKLVDKEHLPKQPSAPKAPPRPKTAKEKIEDQFRIPQFTLPDVFRTPDFTANLPEFRNVGRPSIRRTKSYDVEVPVGKLKHEFIEALDPMYVVFASFEKARSFTIDYRIHAANMPDTVEGQLHVIVNRG